MNTLRDIITSQACLENLFCELITAHLKGTEVPQRFLKKDQAKVTLSAATYDGKAFHLFVTPAEYITILTFACAYLSRDEGIPECRFGSYRIIPRISVEI